MAYTWPVTVTDVHAELNISGTADDTELQGFIDAATAVVENIVGPVGSTAYDEFYDGGGTAIILRHYPVISVETVTEFNPDPTVLNAEPFGTTTYTDTGYRFDPNTGVLIRTTGGTPRAFVSGSGNVRVQYHAGRADVPANVRLAALELVRHLWESQRGNMPSAIAFATDTEPVSVPTGFALPNRVVELLEPHRKAPRVG